MRFVTMGEKKNEAILFFHAMGVIGESSERVARYLGDKYFCIMPTSSVYCKNQRYVSKNEESKQIEAFLNENGIKKVKLVVASPLGADLAVFFMKNGKIPVEAAFFDGGQFGRMGLFTRRILTPILFGAIKSLYKKNGENLGKIMWCDDEEIRPYFVEAGKNLTYRNMRAQLSDSLEKKPFLSFDEEMQKRMYFEFGSDEEHYKYRNSLMKAYPFAHFPVFEGYNHMQYQIRDPEGFAKTLRSIIEEGKMPNLSFLRKR